MTTSVAHSGAYLSGSGAPVVASVPADHVYVRHLLPESGTPAAGRGVSGTVTPAGPAWGTSWWGDTRAPARMLDPYWVSEADFDIYHLHLGFEDRSPGELAELVRVLRRTGRPLVHTVHQLRHPRRADRSLHDAQLDVLVPAADHLITLTPGAAVEIRERWGREADVVPHPHVVDLRWMSVAQDCRSRRSGREFRVGLPLEARSANQDPLALLPTLVELLGDLRGASLQVDCDPELLEPGPWQEPGLADCLRRLAGEGRIDLRVHGPLDGPGLASSLASLDLAVLPYRFGSHSTWLEACRDLGVTVLAPRCGFLHEQGPVLTYTLDEHRTDLDSLREAVVHAHATRPCLGATPEERRRQRRLITRHHDELYRGLVAR